MLGLRINADSPALFFRFSFGERDHLFECRDFKQVIELLRPVGEVLNHPQRFNLFESEVGCEPSFFFGAINNRFAFVIGEFRPPADIGGGNQVRLVARDQLAIFSCD